MVFAPEVRDMYPEKMSTFVEVTALDDKLCGRSRPGHFRGVTTVVSKLFNICQPQMGFFGQKDAQQAIIIKKMVRDLNFPLEIVVGEIIREADGLAMSSRNVYLSPEERKNAVVLYQSQLKAKEQIAEGGNKPQEIIDVITNLLNQTPGAVIEYVEILNGQDLKEIEEIKGKVLLALAVRFGNTRLIDNLLLEVLYVPDDV